MERFTHLGESELSARCSLAERLAMLEPATRSAFLKTLPARLKRIFLSDWHMLARPAQVAPQGDWRIWLIMAGRGFGKTRAGAQWVLERAEVGGRRIALVGPTEDEARGVMVEGASGILASARDSERPIWEPSLARLTWRNGTQAFVYSGANPEALRGPEHDFAWCDELAKWARAEASWDNLMFGLRRGTLPRALVTTTPRPTPLMRKLTALGGVVTTRGRTADAALLAPSVVDYLTGLYGGTRFGRQELDGELIEDVEGSLWPRDLIERCRTASPPNPRPAENRDSYAFREGAGEAGAQAEIRNCHHFLHEISGAENRDSYAFREGAGEAGAQAEIRNCHHFLGGRIGRIVVGVDPPVSARGDACGIVVCALGEDGVAYVVEDASVSGRSPEGWARAVAGAARKWGADRIVAEGNQGGAMVASVLRGADVDLPVTMVHASLGKSARAEPVAALFERGAAKFAGAFPALEDELAGLIAGGGYEGPGGSPDRADAMVWAMTELMLGRRRAEPRIRRL
ncbi:MAG TPA: terminase family protein [Allosphingosinicella sp.]|nr:terminase family protein [Allosphingosinicella sp.]